MNNKISLLDKCFDDIQYLSKLLFTFLDAKNNCAYDKVPHLIYDENGKLQVRACYAFSCDRCESELTAPSDSEYNV